MNGPPKSAGSEYYADLRSRSPEIKDTANIINVLVVDDSAVVRQVLESILSQEPDMSVLVASRGDFSLGEFMREIVSSG
jgi:hypothetical protein